MKDRYDLVIVGGGVAGITAAIRTAQRGLTVAIVEKEKIGGVHVHWGGIPTKALLSTVEVLKKVKEESRRGIQGSVSIDWNALCQHRRRVSTQVQRFNEMALRKYGVEIVYGVGALDSPTRVRLSLNEGDTMHLDARNVLLATGSRSASIPGVTLGRDIVDSDGALQFDRVPESVLIIGGGAVGLEFATLFNLLGTKVTVVELLPTLLPAEELSVGQFITRSLEKSGVVVHVRSKVVDAQPITSGVRVVTETPAGRTVDDVERVLVAVGRKPRIDAEQLEAHGVNTTRRGIIVNTRMQTSVPTVYAAGDVVGHTLLLNVAMQEAKVAAANIAGDDETIDYTAVPRCVFTLPGVAAVGCTEREAQAKERPIHVVHDPFYSPRAAGAGEVDGFIKVITDANGTLLGATIVGSHASELIWPLSLALRLGINARQLSGGYYPSPTYAEAVMNVLGKVAGQAIFGIR